MDQLLVIDPTWHTVEAGAIAGVLAMRGVSDAERHPAIDQLAVDSDRLWRGPEGAPDARH